MEEHIQASGGASGPSQAQVVADNTPLIQPQPMRWSRSLYCDSQQHLRTLAYRGTRALKRTMCATNTASRASYTSSSMNGLGGTIDMWCFKNDPDVSRFEMERSQWEVEKAELQARIAFLQGNHCWKVETSKFRDKK